jgi:TrmH family RNA methyltransferase
VLTLRRLRTRTERERTGTCYVEGVGLVTQALRAGAAVESCVIAPALLTNTAGREAVATLRAAGVPVLELSPQAFGSVSFKENLQGIGAVVRQRIETLDGVPREALDGTPCWVALSEVGNAGNLGAVLRTCDAAGCSGVILLDATADPYHPDALRACRGTIFSLRVVRATFAEFVAWKRARSVSVVGTTPAAEREYRDVEYPAPLVLLMGSERLGLSPEQQAACDLLTRIPMVGHADSLNLAVATSVLLYEVFEQYRRRARVDVP